MDAKSYTACEYTKEELIALLAQATDKLTRRNKQIKQMREQIKELEKERNKYRNLVLTHDQYAFRKIVKELLEEMRRSGYESGYTTELQQIIDKYDVLNR